jgi:tape measure domain-containing protein
MSNTIAAGVVKGQAIIGFLQGTLSAVSNATAGIRQYVDQANNMNATFEATRNSYSILVGGAEKATQILEQMKVEARSTILSFEEFRNAGRYLLAFKFPAEEVVDITKAIGAAVYALGAQNIGGMDRIIRALGQMRTQGRVSMEELNQLSEVGVPALDMLARTFGTTTAAMRGMIKDGTVPVEQAVYGIINQFQQQFMPNMNAVGKSFEVMSSNFTDFVNQAQMAIGSGIFETNKKRLIELTQIVSSPVFMKIATELGGRIGDAYRRFADAAVFPAISAVQQFMNVLDMNNPNPAITQMLGNIEGIMNGLINQYFGGNGIVVVRNFMSVMNQLASGVTTVLRGGDITKALERISSMGQNTAAGRFVGNLAQEISSLGSAMGNLRDFTVPIVNDVVNSFNKLAQSGAVAALQQSLSQFFSITSNDGQTFQLKFGEITSFITTGVQRLQTFLAPIGNAVRDILGAVMDVAPRYFQQASDSVNGFLSSVDRARPGIIQTLQSIVQSVADVGHGVANAIRTGDTDKLMNSITSALTPTWQWLDTWGARALDIMTSNLARIFSGNFDDSAFLSKIRDVSGQAIGFLGQIGVSIADSFGEQLFPKIAPRLQVLGSWMGGQFEIIANGIGNSLNDRLPTMFQIAFNTSETAFSNFFSRLGVLTQKGLVDALMPNLSGSQLFSDYMANENSRIEQEAAARNRVLAETNSTLIQQLNNMPKINEYFAGLGDTSTLVAAFRNIQDSTAPEAGRTGQSIAQGLASGVQNTLPTVTQTISQSTQASLVSSANDVASSAVVDGAWENVGRSIATSVSRGYQSGYQQTVQNIQSSLGIPDIYQQISDSVSEINTLRGRVFVLESIASGGGGGPSSAASYAPSLYDSSSGAGTYSQAGPNGDNSGGQGFAARSSVQKNTNVTININGSSAGSQKELQSMVSYLNIRNAFNF